MKINIIAHPNSKKPRIETDMFKNTHVYVKEPAKDNQANEAITKALAIHYNVTKSAVRLLHGAKSKNKVFDISSD